MNPMQRVMSVGCGGLLLLPLIAALAGPNQTAPGAQTGAPALPPGDGRELVLKQCIGCHAVTVITTQHKSESAWTDTIIEMRNRGANGSDEDMEQIIHYLTANYGPAGAAAGPASAAAKVNVNSASAPDMVAGLALSPAEADAIVAYRAKNGKFADLAGLKQVAGVDAVKIDAVKDRIEF